MAACTPASGIHLCWQTRFAKRAQVRVLMTVRAVSIAVRLEPLESLDHPAKAAPQSVALASGRVARLTSFLRMGSPERKARPVSVIECP